MARGSIFIIFSPIDRKIIYTFGHSTWAFIAWGFGTLGLFNWHLCFWWWVDNIYNGHYLTLHILIICREKMIPMHFYKHQLNLYCVNRRCLKNRAGLNKSCRVSSAASRHSIQRGTNSSSSLKLFHLCFSRKKQKRQGCDTQQNRWDIISEKK